MPPLDAVTGFYDFDASEAGYDELRRIFDFLREEGMIGPRRAGEGERREEDEVRITVVDADDLLDNPNGIVEAYCREVGLEYEPGMLRWDGEEDRERAMKAFEKWRGFHEDAIESGSLRPRDASKVSFMPRGNRRRRMWGDEDRADVCAPKKKKRKTVEEENEEWTQKYGEAAAKMIRETVDRNIPDYEYLKSFALNVPFKAPEED